MISTNTVLTAGEKKALQYSCTSGLLLHYIINWGKMVVTSLKNLLKSSFIIMLQMPSSDGQDLLALQKAIHSSNHQVSRQKDWHPEKMAEIQTHVRDNINYLHPVISGVP